MSSILLSFLAWFYPAIADNFHLMGSFSVCDGNAAMRKLPFPKKFTTGGDSGRELSPHFKDSGASAQC